MSLRKAIAVTIGAEVALAAVVAGGVTCAARSDASQQTAGTSAPVVVQCVETVNARGEASLNRCQGAVSNVAAMMCARAAFLADDYAHTHTGGRQERRAVKRCAALVGGF